MKYQNALGKNKAVLNIPSKARCQNKCSEHFTQVDMQNIHEFY